MDIRIERRREGDRVVVVGLADRQDVVFRVDVRRWVASSRLTGEDLGVPIVEIAELDIAPEVRGPRMAFTALCAALTEALILSDSNRSHLLAVVAEHPNVRRRLMFRPEFRQLSQLPLPFVVTVEDALGLRDRLCR